MMPVKPALADTGKIVHTETRLRKASIDYIDSLVSSDAIIHQRDERGDGIVAQQRNQPPAVTGLD